MARRLSPNANSSFIERLPPAVADERIPPELLSSMREVWKDGMTYAGSAKINKFL